MRSLIRLSIRGHLESPEPHPKSLSKVERDFQTYIFPLAILERGLEGEVDLLPKSLLNFSDALLDI